MLRTVCEATHMSEGVQVSLSFYVHPYPPRALFFPPAPSLSRARPATDEQTQPNTPDPRQKNES